MIKTPNKRQKEIPETPDVIKHHKKSNAKGQPKAKHKHQYETVCLHHKYSLTKPHDPNPWNVDYYSATKVCVICGRIDEADDDYYLKEPGSNLWCNYFKTKLIPETFNLPRWITEDSRCKYARIEDKDQHGLI